MRKPVAAPTMEATMVGTSRCRPETVAEVRRTPWKNKGLEGD
jgi:hypothetical protein